MYKISVNYPHVKLNKALKKAWVGKNIKTWLLQCN